MCYGPAPMDEAPPPPILTAAMLDEGAASPRPAEDPDVLSRLREEYWGSVGAEAVGAAAATHQVIELTAGERVYLLPVRHCRNVVRLPPLARVPRAPAWLRGVLALRGEVIPVIDLPALLDEGTPPVPRRARQRAVIVSGGPLTAALLADGVGDLQALAGPLPEAGEGAQTAALGPGDPRRVLDVMAALELALIRFSEVSA